MSILYGESVPSDLYYPSLYEFYLNNVYRKTDIENTKTCLTEDGQITTKDFNIMIETLSVWLREKISTKIFEVCGQEYRNEFLQPVSFCFDNFKELFKKLNGNNNEDCVNFIIAICLQRSPEFLALLMAIWKLHLPFVPLEHSTPLARTTKILNDSKPIIIVCDKNSVYGVKEVLHLLQMKKFKGTSPKSFSPDSDEENEYLEIDKNSTHKSQIINIEDWKQNIYKYSTKKSLISKTCNLSRESIRKKCQCTNSLACLIYTSGSLGVPKAVPLSTSNFLNRINWQIKCFPYGYDEVCIWSKSCTFIDSYTELLCPLFAGVPLVILKDSGNNPEVLISHFIKYRVTRFLLVPSLLRIFLTYLVANKKVIPILKDLIKLWILSGEAVPFWLVRKFFEYFPESIVCNFYGSTETTGDVSYISINKEVLENIKSIPIGLPIHNTVVFIVKKVENCLEILPENCIGEIAVASLNLSERTFIEKDLEQRHSSSTLSSLYFKEMNDARNLYSYLNSINYFSGENYEIMELSFTQNSRNPIWHTLQRTYSDDSELVDLNKHVQFNKDSEQFKMENINTEDKDKGNFGSLNSFICNEKGNSLSPGNSFKDQRSSSHNLLSRRTSMPPSTNSESIYSDKVKSQNLQLFKPFIKSCSELLKRKFNKVYHQFAAKSQEIMDKEQYSTNILREDNLCSTSAPTCFTGFNTYFGSTSTPTNYSVSKTHFGSTSVPINFTDSKTYFVSTSVPANNTVPNTHFDSTTAPPTYNNSNTYYVLKPLNPHIREKFHVYSTGDLGKIENGLLYFCGRKDNQVKIGGIKIDLSEIDEVIQNSGMVANHHTIVQEDYENDEILEEEQTKEKCLSKETQAIDKVTGDKDTKTLFQIESNKISSKAYLKTETEVTKVSFKLLVTFVVLKEKKEKEVEISEKFLVYLRHHLSSSVLPKIIIIDELPILESGKVDVQELLTWSKKHNSYSREHNILYMTNEDPIELKVLRVICEVIGIKISKDLLKKNFFSIGGTSITSVVAVVRLKEMGFIITLENFLRSPTLAQVVNDILKAKTRSEVMNLFSPLCRRKDSSTKFFMVDGNKVADEGEYEEEEEEEEKERQGINERRLTSLKKDDEEQDQKDKDIPEGEEEEKERRGINERRLATLKKDDEEQDQKGEDEMKEEEEEEPSEIIWMKGPEDEDSFTKAKILNLHPDLPTVLIGGEDVPKKSERNCSIFSTRQTRLKINTLYTTKLPEADPEKEITIELIATSFVKRNPLDIAIRNRKESHYELMKNLWPFLLQKDLSFVVKDRVLGIVGAMISTDFFDEPVVKVPDQMKPIMAIHNHLESRVREELQKEGQHERNAWVHNLFLATDTNLQPQDNVRLALHLEKELLKMSSKKSFKGIFTINSNPSSQLLCSHYLGYETRGSLIVQSFEHEDNLPFKETSKNLRLFAVTKKLK